MATLGKMKIQGIRSFGPDQPGGLQFQAPLTIIVGPNGSGKTTIIECLKYLATGDMPPNSNRGHSFIHHPQVANEVEVKGQIMLEIQDIKGNKFTCTRRLMATQKAKKLEMKTLESTVSREDAITKRITELSSKCADVDQQMSVVLGVAKPIINYVVFCHQEDSNWPMCESKLLKQKFDEIFTATHYIKALDLIKKKQTELNHNLTVIKTDIGHRETFKKKAEEMTAALGEKKNRLHSTQEHMEDIRTQLGPMEKELKDIQKKETKIKEIEGKKGQLESSLRATRDTEQNLLSKIRNLIPGSRRDLEHQLESFHHRLEESQQRHAQCKSKISTVELRIQSLDRQKPRISTKIGHLESKQQDFKEKLQQCDQLLRELSRQGCLSGEYNHTKLSSAVNTIRSSLKECRNQLRATKEEYDGRESSLRRSIDSQQKSLSSAESVAAHHHDQLEKNSREMKEIRGELQNITTLTQDQENVEEKLTVLQQELWELEAELSVEDTKSKIAQLKQKKASLDTKYSSLNKDIKQAQQQQGIRTELDICKKELEQKQAAISELLSKHRSTILNLLEEVPKDNIYSKVLQRKKYLDGEVRKLTGQLNKLQNSLTTLETKKEMLKTETKKKEAELDQIRDRLSIQCGNQDPKSAHSQLQQEIQELQDSKGELTGAQHLFKKYLRELEEAEAKCPLCRRLFTQKEQVTNLIQEIEDQLSGIPKKMEAKQRQIQRQGDKLKIIIQMEPLKEKLDSAEQEDLPKMKKQMEDLNKKLVCLKDESTNTQETLDTLNSDLVSIESIVPDLTLLEQHQRDLDRKSKVHNTLQKQLGNTGHLDLEQLYKQQEEVAAQVQEVASQLEQVEAALSSHINLLHTKTGEVQATQGQLLQIKTRMGNQANLEESLRRLEAECQTSRGVIQTKKVEIKELKEKIKELEAQRIQLLAAREEALENIRDKESQLNKHLTSLHTMQENIERYRSEGFEEQLDQAREELHQVEESISQKNRELRTLREQLEKLADDTNAQELREQELKDCLHLAQCRERMDQWRRQVEQLEEEIAELGIDPARGTQLAGSVQKLHAELGQAQGRLKELQEQVRSSQQELAHPDFSQAGEKFRIAAIDRRVTELTLADLKKYYDTLDRAVIEFHRIKMNELNKIIRDLWNTVYRGNDIEYIEIVSDVDEARRNTERVRQSYNYKVVMSKNGAKLDMRSHSSAGQKVLASLIIRLALAETFCLHCGIFALDEPTTNLDSDNIESLAHALVNLVESRVSRKNFQLIIITHDEEFLSLLGRAASLDRYYKVYKNEDGLSQIQSSHF